MIDVAQALELVISNAGRQAIVPTPLADALHCVLAEDVVSDIDSPPFAKALMDGYAVRSDDFVDGEAVLQCIGEVAAGTSTTGTVKPGTTMRLMTGAPIPAGADAVVMIEKSQTLTDQNVHLDAPGIRPGQNCMPKGRELSMGESVLLAGTVLGPVEIGVLATVGQSKPRVFARPSLAIVSTGDELVSPDQIPAGPQIRNSNESLMAALARQERVDVRTLGIVRDDASALSECIREGLKSDVLLLSGGVSAGKFDLVPKVLASLGVEQVFHKVQFKPGKPIWFGRHANGLVFGLPGNPVSVMACFCLFVRTALSARRGFVNPKPRHFRAALTEAFEHSADRLTFHPAKFERNHDRPTVRPAPWFGSADLKALTNANGFLVLPEGAANLPAGAIVDVLPFASGPD